MAPEYGIHPDTKLLDADGRDWQWAYVVFREIPGWPGYLAGSDGWLWSRRKAGQKGGFRANWKAMRLKPSKYGYRHTRLCDFGRMRHVAVHSVILNSFFGPCPAGMVGRHLNGKPWDNRIINLAWGTAKENTHDSIRHGTFARGTKQPGAKLTEADIPVIRELLVTGLSHQKISDRYTVCRETISQIARGQKWKGVS